MVSACVNKFWKWSLKRKVFGRKYVQIRNRKIREMQYIAMFMKRHYNEVL